MLSKQLTKPFFLILIAAILSLSMLGSHELWTQEGRWGTIGWHMMTSKDYFHPTLNGYPYYDKPVLTYWLQIFCGMLMGHYNEWALRSPSALCSILAVWSIYKLGSCLHSKRMGLYAGWMLVSTYAFIFWGRTASSDIYNIAGILLALFFYFNYKQQRSFITYSYFFLTLAIASLCKGIVCIAIVFVALLPDLIYQNNWRNHLNIKSIAAIIVAAIIYFAPFIFSNFSQHATYHGSGLNEVFRENVVRYFDAWDHKDPIYTYFLYLPVYIFPWIIFFIPAVIYFVRQWKNLNANARWSAWAFILVFIFLTSSESRRNYYTLMLVPFALLITAQWLSQLIETSTWLKAMKAVTIISVIILFIAFVIAQPIGARKHYLTNFANNVHTVAEQQSPWNSWQVALLDASVKVPFYLRPATPVIPINQVSDLPNVWTPLVKKYPHLILVTRAKQVDGIKAYLKGYQEIIAAHKASDKNYDVAFVPIP